MDRTCKQIKDNSKVCGSYPCDGGKDCWENAQPIRKQCIDCLCSFCTLSKCTGGKLIRQECARFIATGQDTCKLIEHILAMADDNYLDGHPEWIEIVKEARTLSEHIKGGK